VCAVAAGQAHAVSPLQIDGSSGSSSGSSREKHPCGQVRPWPCSWGGLAAVRDVTPDSTLVGSVESKKAIL